MTLSDWYDSDGPFKDNHTGAITAATLRSFAQDAGDEIEALQAITHPDITDTAVVYVTESGDDDNDGLSWRTAKATVPAAVQLLDDEEFSYGTVRVGYGDFDLPDTLTIPQAIRLVGMGPLPLQGTTLTYTGLDDGRYAIVTAAATSGADTSWGTLRGFLLKPAPGMTQANGIKWRNAQNGSLLEEVRVQDFPGIGVYANGENGGVPLNAFPGWVTARRVWSTGNGVNWKFTAAFTGVLLDMCGGDISTRTTDVMVIDNPASGTRGKDGSFTLIGFKTEDNGTPSSPGSTANYITVNSDVQLNLIGCSAKKGTPGTKPWVNYTASPSSPNAPSGSIPVTIVGSSTANIAVAVQGPTGAALLAPGVANAGEVFQISHWSGWAAATKWQGTHSGFVADAVQVLSADAAAVPVSVVPAVGQSAHLLDLSAASVYDPFTRADSGSSLGSATTGGAWTAGTGTWGISSNKAYLNSVTADAHAMIDSGYADGTLTCDITLSATRAHAGVIVRAATVSDIDGLYVRYKPSVGDLILMKRVTGVGSATLESQSVSWAVGTTKTLKVVTLGTNIKAYLDGTLVLNHTLAGGDIALFTTPTVVGLYEDRDGGTGDDGGTRFDNFNFVAVRASVDAGGMVAAQGFANKTATWTSGSGSPESVVTAPVGSLFTRTDGSTSTTLYVKESGSGNTGWVAK